jgi:hypothetical protein
MQDMVSEAERQQFALDLRQLQNQPVAIEALIRHLDHIARDDPQYEARDLLAAAGSLATALARVLEDTEPGLRVQWTRGKPHPQPRHCRQGAAGAS